MNEVLRTQLTNFCDITSALIKLLRENSYDDLEKLFKNRQACIDEIEKISYTQQEFIELCNESKLSELQDTLYELLNSKKLEIKVKMDKFSGQKNAGKSYIKLASESIYFNKKY